MIERNPFYMKPIQLFIEKPLTYILTGKFKSPSSDWKHMKRTLLDYELIIVTDGIFYLTVNQIPYTIKKGDYLLCPPNSQQMGQTESDCSFYWLHFMESETDYPDTSTTTIQNNSVLEIPFLGICRNFEKLIILMKHLQDSIRTYQNQMQNNYFTTIILCELYNQSASYLSSAKYNTINEQLIYDIKDYIKWYRNTNLKVIDIAAYFGYHEKYLSQLFQKMVGLSLKQYIIQEKLELAKFLLTDTNDTITSISQQLGFHDSHAFMKLFKKQTGITATAYRNANKKRLLYYI